MMTELRNPFTSTFGIVPPYLAGRDLLLSEMGRAFEGGLGDPNLSTLFVGPRGSGKTALLSCVGNEARESGWIVVDAVAEPGMLMDILMHATVEAEGIIDSPAKRHLSGSNLGNVVGLEWEREGPEPSNWRMDMELLLGKLGENGTGLLVTVDEVRVDVDELVRLVSGYQLFIRASFTMGLVMAGLPANVTDLVDDKRVSFLRRARERYLGPIGDADVSRAFRRTIEQGGKTIEDDALAVAVNAAGGFPYMIQLVGYHTWAESGYEPVIREEHASRGADGAKAEFTRGVLDRTWREMSKGDRTFAQAMLPDGGTSTLTDVAKRMGRGTNYASTYKKRLMRQGIISDRGGGTFDFDIPMMREFLQAAR